MQETAVRLGTLSSNLQMTLALERPEGSPLSQTLWPRESPADLSEAATKMETRTDDEISSNLLRRLPQKRLFDLSLHLKLFGIFSAVERRISSAFREAGHCEPSSHLLALFEVRGTKFIRDAAFSCWSPRPQQTSLWGRRQREDAVLRNQSKLRRDRTVCGEAQF